MKTISRHFTNIGTQPRPDLYCAVQVIELCVNAHYRRQDWRGKLVKGGLSPKEIRKRVVRSFTRADVSCVYSNRVLEVGIRDSDLILYCIAPPLNYKEKEVQYSANH